MELQRGDLVEVRVTFAGGSGWVVEWVGIIEEWISPMLAKVFDPLRGEGFPCHKWMLRRVEEK